MYVSIKCSVKDVFDNALKAPALKALGSAVRSAVEANKAFDTKKAEKTQIVLTASASVSADDNNKPTELKAAVAVDGLLTGAAPQAFKASGNGKLTGVNARKIERDVEALVESVAADLMKDKVIAQMLKMKP